MSEHPPNSGLITGGCMCGRVRYEGCAPPLHTGYCHCRSCRHHSGAAVAGMLVFDIANVSFPKDPPRRYTSSPGIERGFCPTCGTSLIWAGHGLISVHIGTLDDPDAHPPSLHWRFDERSTWVDHAQDLPKVKMTIPGRDEAG